MFARRFAFVRSSLTSDLYKKLLKDKNSQNIVKCDLVLKILTQEIQLCNRNLIWILALRFMNFLFEIYLHMGDVIVFVLLPARTCSFHLRSKIINRR